MAVLLAFLLNPLAKLLEKCHLGRAAPVFLTVLLAMGVVGLLGWVLEVQFVNVANKLPGVREEIKRKISDLREAQEQIDRLAQPFMPAPTPAGDQSPNPPS
jgi:predicted PurR-regulated permease PerM